MKITEQELKQIIKEELNEMMDEPMEELDSLVGAPLTPKEREESDKSYEKKMRAKEMSPEMSDTLSNLQAKGLTKEQIMLLVQQELDKY
jgi:hypothetical protein